MHASTSSATRCVGFTSVRPEGRCWAPRLDAPATEIARGSGSGESGTNDREIGVDREFDAVARTVGSTGI